MHLPELNIPTYECEIKNKDGKSYIFDVIRKKMIVLTPEEWVRQQFVHFLIKELNYSKSLMKVESGIGYNQLQKRSDIKIYNRQGEPFAIVECKAPSVKIDQKTFDQVATYNKTFKASFIIVTNGMQHFSCEIDFANGKTKFLEGFPEYK